jgi:hypothetical protein
MNCSECKQPIRDGMQITVYKSNFHPDCAVKAVQTARRRNEQRTDGVRKEKQDESLSLQTDLVS